MMKSVFNRLKSIHYKDSGDRLDLIASVVLGLWGIFWFYASLQTSISAALWPFNGYWGDQSGGSQLNFAIYIADGRNYFTNPSDYPMLVPQTPGLFPLLIAPFVKLWGPSLYYGSILGLLSFLITMVCVFILTRGITDSSLWAVGALGFLLSFPRLAVWLTLNRPDSLAYALSIATVMTATWAVQRTQTTNLGSWILSAFLGVAACYAKQTAAIAIISVGAYLVMQRKWRWLFIYVSSVLTFGLLPMIYLERWTQGGFLYNIVTLTRGMTIFGFKHWLIHITLTLIALAPLLLCATKTTINSLQTHKLLPLHYYAMGTLLLGIATIWHTGGSFGYFGWAITALAPLGACGLQMFVNNAANKRSTRHIFSTIGLLVLVIGWAILLLVLSPFQTFRDSWQDSLRYVSDMADRSQVETVYEVISNLPGEILTERLTGLEVLQNRNVMVETHSLYILASKGLWEPTKLENDLACGHWSYVVSMSNRRECFAGLKVLDDALNQGYIPLDDQIYAFGDREITIWQRRVTTND